jgi:hypothetical protein
MLLFVRCVRIAHVDGIDNASIDSTALSPSLPPAAVDLGREFRHARHELDDCVRLLRASFDDLESKQILLEEENRWLRAEADAALVRAGFAEARAAAAGSPSGPLPPPAAAAADADKAEGEQPAAAAAALAAVGPPPTGSDPQVISRLPSRFVHANSGIRDIQQGGMLI